MITSAAGWARSVADAEAEPGASGRPAHLRRLGGRGICGMGYR